MALSVSVTKKNITNTQKNLYGIVLELILTDTTGAGFTKEYSQEYRTGENVNSKVQVFINKMQEDIDQYKAAKTLSDNSALATAIINIQNGLIL
jgi:hypothetical protein